MLTDIEIKKLIASIDLSMITDTIVRRLKWKKEEAEQTCQLYRNFLFLQKKYGKSHTIVPSEEVDEFWHNHILDTEKYSQDCSYLFNEFLHHYPYFGFDKKSTLSDLEEAFLVTQELHFKEFGYYIERIKPHSLCKKVKLIINCIIKG